MDLLRRIARILLDNGHLDLYEFAKESPQVERLCYASAQLVIFFHNFGSSAVIDPSSADDVFPILTKAVTRFKAVQKLGRRADIRGISLDTLLFIAKSSTSEREYLQAVNDDTDNSKRCKVDNHTILDLQSISTVSLLVK